MNKREKAISVRIIGGCWRGRRVRIPSFPGVRPTPDRVRETLFNWLRDEVEGAKCLDLFAGSGALGIEALSRGASSVIFVDQSSRVVTALRETLGILHADKLGQVVLDDALSFLRHGEGGWDIVFVDPPYESNVQSQVLSLLARLGRVPKWVYLETSDRDNQPLPDGYQTWRDKTAGAVRARLLKLDGFPPAKYHGNA